MKFTDFREQILEATPGSGSATDPVYLRKLLRGAKADVNGKQIPVNVSRVMRAADIFQRTGKMQSIPKSIMPHYSAYMQRQQDLSAKFANRAGQLKMEEIGEEEVIEIVEDGQQPVNAPNVIMKSVDPPPVILLKRTGIRVFPNGQRVAVYVNQKLGLTFSVPYDAYQEYKPGAAFGGKTIPGVQVK